jgi:succinate dehydrogenase / fumarate reductase flavoprotein subunit
VSRFLKDSDGDVDHAAITKARVEVVDQIDHLARGSLNASEIRERMRGVLSDNAGVFRDRKSLTSARDILSQLAEDAARVKVDSASLRFNSGLITVLELPMMIDLAMIICEGALARTESRGSHYRTDYESRDDGNWLKHTIAVRSHEGLQLRYSEIDLSKYEPKERKY